MNVVVNGEPTELGGTPTVVDVLTALGREPSARGVAVAVNGEVVRKAAWSSTRIEAGDRIEVLTAVGGG